MATAFDTFDQYAFGHYPGQIEDRGMADVVSRVAAGSDIGYGLGVIDTGIRDAKLPTGSEVSTGITVRESMLDTPAGDNPTPVYKQDHEMSVIRVGRVWVSTVDGAAIGEQVYVVPATGALTNTDNSATNIALPGAVFKSAAAAGEMAIVQLNGN
jgi:hypothetical protein